MFEAVRCVAFDINGTLISGRYLTWEDIFEKRFGLRKRGDKSLLMDYDLQTGRLSFEEALSRSYVVERPGDLMEAGYKVYIADLKLRDGCIDLLEALQQKYDLVVCSDTSGVTKTLVKKLGLEGYFSRFFYSCDMGWMKSDRGFWTTFLLSFPLMRPDEFVMIGDSPSRDVRWPNVVGMGTIQIETTELSQGSLEALDERDHPNVYIRELSEIRDLLAPPRPFRSEE